LNYDRTITAQRYGYSADFDRGRVRRVISAEKQFESEDAARRWIARHAQSAVIALSAATDTLVDTLFGVTA